MHPHIQTERLFLRPPRPSDAQEYIQPLNDWSVVRYLTSIPQPYGIEDAHEFITNMAVPGQFWVIEDGEGFQGMISCTDDLGYWLKPSAWGKGYITEAGDAVLDARFNGGDVDELFSSHHPANDASQNALTKLGFIPNGKKSSYFIPLDEEVVMNSLRVTRARWQERRQFRVATPRLRLREYRQSDYAFSYEMGRHLEVARMTSSIPHPWSIDAAKAWSRKCTYTSRPNFTAIITLPNGLPIGAIGIGRKSTKDRCNVGYMMLPDYWGHGYMSEAVNAFCRACFDRFGIDEIEAGHFHDNPASGRVLLKCGFTFESISAEPSQTRVEAEDILLYRLDRSISESKAYEIP